MSAPRLLLLPLVAIVMMVATPTITMALGRPPSSSLIYPPPTQPLATRPEFLLRAVRGGYRGVPDLKVSPQAKGVARVSGGATAAPPAPPSRLNYLNLLAYLLNIAVTYLVGATGRVGKTNAEVSEKYTTLFTPAGWAFSIWGVIFLWEGAFSIYQLASPRARHSDLVQKGIGYWWIIMVVLQCGWSVAFAKEALPASLTLMVGILFSLYTIVNNSRPYWTTNTSITSTTDYNLLVAPFSLNLGWIMAATLANFNIVVVGRGSSPSVQLATTVISLVIAALATTYMGTTLNPGDPYITGAITWAITAISANLKSPPAQLVKSGFPPVVTEGLSQAASLVADWSAFSTALAVYSQINQKKK